MTKLQSYRSIYILNDLLYRHIDRAAVAAVAHSQSEGPDKGVFLSGMPQYATHYQGSSHAHECGKRRYLLSNNVKTWWPPSLH